VVEQLIRNQQARGSTPLAGSSEIKGLAILANPIFFMASILASIIEDAVSMKQKRADR
jgi:hypothetical protein